MLIEPHIVSKNLKMSTPTTSQHKEKGSTTKRTKPGRKLESGEHCKSFQTNSSKINLKISQRAKRTQLPLVLLEISQRRRRESGHQEICPGQVSRKRRRTPLFMSTHGMLWLDDWAQTQLPQKVSTTLHCKSTWGESTFRESGWF